MEYMLKQASFYCRYTTHSEVMICGVASRALKNVLFGMPALRNSLIAGMVTFVLNLSDDQTQVHM